MFHLQPLRPGVIDAATGLLMPSDGVQRAVLLPPDHYSKRTGDLEIKPVVKQTHTEPMKAKKEDKK